MYILDTREPKSVHQELSEVMGEAPVRHSLTAGDILFPSEGLLIERKTVLDFASSLADGRLTEQCRSISNLNIRFPALLVHGSLLPNRDGLAVLDGRVSGWNFWSLQMALVSVQLAGLLVITVPHSIWPEAVKYLSEWARKSQHLKAKPFEAHLWQQGPALQILTTLTGSSSRASQVAQNYPNLLQAINDFENWSSLKGIGPHTMNRITSILKERIR